ncbi:hypothetical protein C8A05DRAFT_16236, partial [Staphylotrichum tortipilum]
MTKRDHPHLEAKEEEKPEMTIQDLELNGIFLDENPAGEGTLPRHIDMLRARLVDFACITALVDGLDDDDFEQSDAWRCLHPNTCALVRDCRATSVQAKKFRERKDKEPEWQAFFDASFFTPLQNAVGIKDEDTRLSARAKYDYEYFESLASRHWTLFGGNKKTGRKGHRQDDRRNLTEPRPDRVAFFPISTDGGTRIQRAKGWQSADRAQDGITENFSFTTLQHLAKHGVESNTAGLFRKSPTKLDTVPSNCISFPWLIIEYKKLDQRALITKGHCQAANAGACAIMMLETLSKIVPEAAQNEHIPPVVTMTTAGPLVQVWIMYSCKPSVYYRMDCIWKGVITLASDVVKLQAILENTFTWAMRELRPRLSTYIDLWK